MTVIMEHALSEASGDSMCACGEPFLCVSRRILLDANRGIFGQVEESEAMRDRRSARGFLQESSGQLWTRSSTCVKEVPDATSNVTPDTRGLWKSA